MSMNEPTAWLVGDDGARRRVSGQGLLIGRGPSCDIIVSDATSSKEQALVRRGRGRLELHPLGRNPTLVNGEEVERSHRLENGDVIEVPGARFEVLLDAEPTERYSSWMLAVGGARHRVPNRPLTVGSSDQDELHIAQLPPNALTFFTAGDGLLVEVTEEGFQVDGAPLEPDEVHPVGRGRKVTWNDVTLEVVASTGLQETPTTHMAQLPILRKIEFRYMPTGGELTVDYTCEVVTCQLSELRCRLTVALIQPPEPYTAGEFVPDEVILPLVWPRQPERSHYDLNTLVHRLRKDLLRAGLDPTQLIERARGGGGARVRVTRDVEIAVH